MCIITAWQHISPHVIVKDFKCSAEDETDDDKLWNGSEEDGNIRCECEEVKALTVEMETVTLIGTGRWNLTHFVY
jgi:hypothetical protein